MLAFAFQRCGTLSPRAVGDHQVSPSLEKPQPPVTGLQLTLRLLTSKGKSKLHRCLWTDMMQTVQIQELKGILEIDKCNHYLTFWFSHGIWESGLGFWDQGQVRKFYSAHSREYSRNVAQWGVVLSAHNGLASAEVLENESKRLLRGLYTQHRHCFTTANPNSSVAGWQLRPTKPVASTIS